MFRLAVWDKACSFPKVPSRRKPIYLLIWIYGAYFATRPLFLKLFGDEASNPLRELADRLFDLGIFAVLFWLFFRLTRVLESRLSDWAKKTDSKLDDLLVPLLGRSLRVIVPVVGLIFALPVIGLPPQYAGILAKGSSILIIGSIAWILSQGVRLGEQAVLARFDITAADNLRRHSYLG